MKGLAIDFNGSKGLTIVTDQAVEDFNATVQNGLVVLATDVGSDVIFPTKGTNLHSEALAGNIPTAEDAYHTSNFAALDTKAFLNENNPDQAYEDIDQFILEPFTYTENGLKLNAVFYGTDDSQSGVSIEVT